MSFRVFNVGVFVLFVVAVGLAGCVGTPNQNKTVSKEHPLVLESKNIVNQSEIGNKTKINLETQNKTQDIMVFDKKADSREYPDLNYIISIINNSSITDQTDYNFTNDPSFPNHVRSSQMKYYTLEITENMGGGDRFCTKYCAANWSGWNYYVNMSDYEALTPLLERKDFEKDEDYREYEVSRTLVNETIIERPIDLQNGKILEYQLISWRRDYQNTFIGAYLGTFLVYKIFCSPNITIFIRPKWNTPKWNLDEFWLLSMRTEDAYKTWNSYVMDTREEMINKSEKILENCPENARMFENYSFPTYYDSRLLAVYWKPYYKNQYNITESIKVGIENSSFEGKYLLKYINVSFVNNGVYETYETNLIVSATSDSGVKVYFYDDIATNNFRPGDIVNRSFSNRELEFSENFTVDATLYTVESKAELRPMKVTFSRKDFQ